MDYIQLLENIETLAHPNEPEEVRLPDLEPNAAAYETPLHCRERQLIKALRCLAITEADLNDSHDIIKQWRANSGYTMIGQGEIVHTQTTIH